MNEFVAQRNNNIKFRALKMSSIHTSRKLLINETNRLKVTKLALFV